MIVRCDWCNKGVVPSRLVAVRITAGAVEDRPAKVCPSCAEWFPAEASR